MTGTTPADPLDRIEWVSAAELSPNPWNPNRVHRPELKLLEQSLLLTGWIQPVLARRADGMIIDGFHRWRLAQDAPAVTARYDGRLPVAYLDVSREDAMLLTVRINRAKGSHASTLMSALVRDLLDSGVPRERIMVEMGATAHEVDLLAAEDVFKARSVAAHAYSPSWYPVEADRPAVIADPLEAELESKGLGRE